VRKLAERYADAIERADVETLLALLTEDAVWSMPPLASWYTGRDAIAAFLVDYPLSVRWRHLPTQANGQVAIGCYMWNEERGCFAAEVIDVLTLRDDLIGEVTAFISADIFTRFGLPAELPPQER
jgi:RNA polymerase sigma-70 factor (ECF subfamily)